MSEEDLLTAMRLGSRNPLDKRILSDLGRFGLGLKTASFSQCRRLTVVTRQAGKTSAAIWDLDYVSMTNEWLVQIPEDPTGIPWVENIGESGTLVLWEKLDRLLENTTSSEARTHFIRRLDETRVHLELVFHRFLSGERGLAKVNMFLNGCPLDPFDPFHSSHLATIHGPKERIRIAGAEIVVQAFTLPHHSKVSFAEWDHYATPAGYQKSQGFFVYREKRLIIHGTWFGLARQTELTKLARVRIDIHNGLDSEWKIDVKKSSAQLPYQVRQRLRKIIETIGANSKRVYTARGRKLTADSRLPVWNRVQDKNEIVYRINAEHPMFLDFISRLPKGMREEFINLLELTGSALPMDALFVDLSGVPEKVKGNTISEETLRLILTVSVQYLQEQGVPLDDIADSLRLAEPFRSNWKMAEAMLKTMIMEEKSGDRKPKKS